MKARPNGFAFTVYFQSCKVDSFAQRSSLIAPLGPLGRLQSEAGQERSQGDLFDLELDNAGRGVGFDDVTDGVTEEGFGDGRLDGDLAFAEVGLVGIDDGVGHGGAVGYVGEANGAEEAYGGDVELGGIEHGGMGEDVGLELDLAHRMAQESLGGMVLEVLAEVALGTGL